MLINFLTIGVKVNIAGIVILLLIIFGKHTFFSADTRVTRVNALSGVLHY